MVLAAAKCPECGADITLPSDVSSIVCRYCGKSISPHRVAVGTAIPSAEHLISLARAAENSGNHGEAYDYWTRVLEIDPENAEAWLGKAVGAGWQSDLIADRLEELTTGVEQALRFVRGNRDVFAADAANQVLEVIQAYYGISIEHTKEDSSWPEHIERSLSMLRTLEKAFDWAPRNKKLRTEALAIVDALLKGLEYPKGELSEGYEYLNVPPELRPELERTRARIIARVRKLDSSFVATSVKPVKGPGCGCILIIVALAVVVLFGIILMFGKISRGGWF